MFINETKKFDLIRVNFKVPLTDQTDNSEVVKRVEFYNVQMDHLKKTAEHWDMEENPKDTLPYKLHTYHDVAIMSWSTEEDLEFEYFPH